MEVRISLFIEEYRQADVGFGRCGANEWTRTTDRLFTKQLLCRLSYVGSYADLRNAIARAGMQRDDGANEWTRTTDLLFTKQLLCRLSYVGALAH